MSQQENQLKKLLKDAERVINDTEIETCTQWIDREVQRTQKLKEQIERQQNHSSIPAKLFNEARDTVDGLQRFIENLKDFRSNMARNGHQVVITNSTEARASGILKNASYSTEYKCPF
ncbi:uncharacterized protein LOC113798135 [Dermatophagoides pteronyssinus]|uniref:uncharacterized protein LOC113798135 n=1 Tax=Dermatophagoides pteronyssinus TaxID=6956 RepID=UPI003F6672D8